MKLNILAVYDSKAQLFSHPIYCQAIGQAVRSFADAVNDGKSDYCKHPEDYTLFHLGNYDDNTGALEPLPTPNSLGLAVSYITSDPRQLSLLKAEA